MSACIGACLCGNFRLGNRKPQPRIKLASRHRCDNGKQHLWSLTNILPKSRRDLHPGKGHPVSSLQKPWQILTDSQLWFPLHCFFFGPHFTPAFSAVQGLSLPICASLLPFIWNWAMKPWRTQPVLWHNWKQSFLASNRKFYDKKREKEKQRAGCCKTHPHWRQRFQPCRSYRLKALLTEDEVTLVPSTTAGTKIDAQTRTPTFSRTVKKKKLKGRGREILFPENHITHSIPGSVRDLC